MKRSYSRPTLVEYGPIAQLTLGSGGNLPDTFNGNDTNTNCTANGGVTSCNVSAS